MSNIRLRKLIEENNSVLKEAEEVEFSELDRKEQDVIHKLLKLLDVGKNPSAIFKGIHGTIVHLDNDHPVGEYRFDIKELKQLSKLPIRWIESDKRHVKVGF